MIDDYVQDALELLDESEASYLVIIPFGRRTIFHSNLGAGNAQKMVNAFADGWLSNALVEHLHGIIEEGGVQ